MIKGAVVFDGLVVGRLSADFMVSPFKVEATAAFVSSKTGQTHGWTKSEGGWSQGTLDLLKQLRESMERDIAKLHLSASDETRAETSGLNVGGIGEHLTGDDKSPDAPSV